ncbi:7-keto-8-aminopelargonate synthetase [Catalinimonas alkaloidigena]|uniref:7-keto-8-aminopelargonate synthetase n=2 Tax=Catalinimonas alkaloidigena TaxID=1075417 RepID=A0A1G9N6C8_9BACT|nr:7-keto-8-aminopelargonate synthetase [Catalinimonas alkaloidigena]
MLDTIGSIILNAKKEKLLHLYAEGEYFDGRHIQVQGKHLFHFGTTGYLGLEQDQRLKDAAIDAIQRYGTQFPLSKTYISFPIYKELEESLRQIYQRPIVVTKNSTLAHIGVIPTIVRDEDALILDQQVHASVQNASQLLKPRGIPVQLVKHSDIGMLEDTIKSLRDKHQKIWYAADGVYSMYGDVVPLHELLPLMEKYPQLHLYIDDVHGMSWAGRNGAGYVMSQLGELRERIILVGTLSKSFGASGSVVAFGDEDLYEAFRIFGGPQTFSAQLEPSSVAAALASAKIHLSDEIYELQRDLAEKVAYCNELIRATDLPLIQENVCPVHFIGGALPAVSYNFARRLMDDGFYINVATFPAVPVKNTGIRFTISRHNQKEDIRQLVEAMTHHYPIALQEEGYSMNQVRKAFRLAPLKAASATPQTPAPTLRVQLASSINEIEPAEWNALLGERGAFDWNALAFYEQAFSKQPNPHHNWKFIYLLIRDNTQKVVLATFFTVAWWKDDMLAPAAVSEQVEKIRAENPDYLVSQVLSMGSLITDGEHLYLDKRHPQYKEALKTMNQEIEQLRQQYNCSTVALRDLDAEDEELNTVLHAQGYLQVDMPEGTVVESLDWQDQEDYLQRLSTKSRSHVKKDVLKYKKYYKIEVKSQLTDEELTSAYDLYKNVSAHNYALNNVEFPLSLFQDMNQSPHWEAITFRLKGEHTLEGRDMLIGVSFSYKTSEGYCGVLLGMDYRYSKEYKVYKQILFENIMRAQALGKKRIYLGLTSAQEKRKYGATLKPRLAYLQTQDNYKLELIESLATVQ